MTDLERIRAMCEALYRKERENVRDESDGCNITMQATPASNEPNSKPGVTLPPYVARTAINLAERAVDEINADLRDAERQRDELARKLGAQQDMVDRLLGEREYRTRHVRDLTASVPAP